MQKLCEITTENLQFKIWPLKARKSYRKEEKAEISSKKFDKLMTFLKTYEKYRVH